MCPLPGLLCSGWTSSGGSPAATLEPTQTIKTLPKWVCGSVELLELLVQSKVFQGPHTPAGAAGSAAVQPSSPLNR